MREDDELAQQPQREELQPEHDQQRRQQQRRPLREFLAEEQPLDDDPGDEQGANGEQAEPDHAEEPERLLGEANQEEDREDVQETARVDAGLVDAFVAVLRGLPDVDLADAEALAVGEDRQEAVLVAVELDLLQHAAVAGAGAAAEVAELEAGNGTEQAVESRAPHPLEGAAGPRPATGDCEVAVGECSDQVRQLVGLDLEVRRQGDDDLPGRLLEARHERSRLAERPREADHREACALGREPLESGDEPLARTVEDEDDFIAAADRIETATVLAVQRGGIRTAAADRNDHGNLHG